MQSCFHHEVFFLLDPIIICLKQHFLSHLLLVIVLLCIHKAKSFLQIHSHIVNINRWRHLSLQISLASFMTRQRGTEISQVQVESDFVFKMADRYQYSVRRTLFGGYDALHNHNLSLQEKNGFD